MKAISIKQPWAFLIASGEKTIETRVWFTRYRGDLLIVSSLKPVPGLVLGRHGEKVYGKALCVAKLVDCRPMVEADQDAAMCEVYDKAFSWVLEDIRPIKPFAVKGQLGIYEVSSAELKLRRVGQAETSDE